MFEIRNKVTYHLKITAMVCITVVLLRSILTS